MNQKQFLINQLEKISDKIDAKEASLKKLHTKRDSVWHKIVKIDQKSNIPTRKDVDF